MEKQTDRGVLKYRMPNILEIYDFIENSGIVSGKVSSIIAKKNIISSMGDLIDFSGIDGVLSYSELLDDVDNMVIPLSDIADEIIDKAFAVFGKKNSSRMPSV